MLRVFPVAVGADASPSPNGRFRNCEPADRTYLLPLRHSDSGRHGQSARAALGGSQQEGLRHSRNKHAGSIGKAASHGCIRMRNRDIVQFFAHGECGDTVEIHGQRDEEIAEIFGGEADEDRGRPGAQRQRRIGGWAVVETTESHRGGVMQLAITAIAVVAGMVFSVAIALLVEEFIFGEVFRLFFARQAVRAKAGTQQ